MEAALPASNGQPVTIPSQQILCRIASINSLGGGATAPVGGTSVTSSIGGGGTADVVFNLPPGANSVIILGGKAGGPLTVNFTRVAIIGVQSNTVYYDSNLINTFGQWPIAVVISSAADSQLEMQLTFADNAQITVELAASFGTQAVDISGQASVNIASVGGAVVPTSFGILDVLGAGGTPKLANPGANTNAVVTLSGIPGEFLHVLTITSSWNAATTVATNVVVSGSALGAVWVRDYATGAVGAQHDTFPNGGMVFGSGETVTITQLAGGAGVFGHLSVVALLAGF